MSVIFYERPCTWMLAIYWGLFFISDMPSVYNSSESSVKEDDNGCKCNM